MNRIVFFLLLLAGCASIPKSEMAQRLSPQTLETSVSAALETGDFVVGQWPSADWWEMFGDPQLSSLITEALRENPTLMKATARIHEAKQFAKQKRAYLFPDLSANYEENWQHLSKNGLFRFFAPTFPSVINLIDISLNFNYEIDFWGKNSNLFKAAIGAAHAEVAEYAQARLMVTTALTKAYFDLQANEEKTKIMKEILQQRKALHELISARTDHGLDTDIESLGAEQNVYDIEKTLLSLEAAASVSRHLITALLGRGPDSEVVKVAAGTQAIFSFPLPENISADLLARRPDLMAQIWRVEAAAHRINAAKTNFYPNVNLCAALGFESLSFSKLFLWESNSTGLTPAVHLPIFTAGRLRAELKEKVAQFDEAVYEYNELVLNAAKEVADKLTTLGKVNEQVRVQRMVLESVRQSTALKFLRYTQGVANYLTVITSQEALLNQRFIAVDLAHEQLLETVGLIKALGGGYE